ncbi:MAG: sigma-70 family RNA polymerase sigma factor [Solobacterium sp.]|nr:sigma-70 family RNA polymerase sigma factor [Solobacterium sp.]
MENPYELLYMHRLGSEEALKQIFSLYQPVVRNIVQQLIKKMKRLEIYEEDMIQEGLIAISQAIDTFRYDRNCSFGSFLYMIVHRKLCSYLRYYSSKRTPQPHNTLSLSQFVSEYGVEYDFIPNANPFNDPEFSLYYNEGRMRIQEKMASLTQKERDTLKMWIENKSYKEASEALNISYKAYDNRLQRLKKAIKEVTYNDPID